jgi:hypothetical protein
MENDRSGFRVTEQMLLDEGFTPLTLESCQTDLQLASESACEWTTRGSVPTATVRDVELLSGPILNRVGPIAREVLWVVALALTGLLVGAACAIAIGVLKLPDAEAVRNR